MQDEHAQPVLIQMLQEYLPPPYSLPGELRPDWFDIEHLHVAQILGDWGDTSLIPTLRATMLRVWEIERGAPAHLQGMGVSIWQDYQEELSYALSRLGDFPFLLQLKNIGAPDYRVQVWTNNFALGYAHIQGGGMKRIDIVDGATRPKSPYAHFGEILLQLLQQHAGWDRQEALTALCQYGYDYFRRHETTTPSEQQKE